MCDETTDTHVFRDPREAVHHFTPEAMARALPRSLALRPDGTPLSPPSRGDDEAPPD